MKHVMLDLETLGTGSNAVIVSISAVVFDPFKPLEIYESTFHKGLNILEQLVTQGVEIDLDTIRWWQQQDDEAKRILIETQTYSVAYVLNEFNKFLEDLKSPDLSLWGNGATFDCVILRNLYKRHNHKFILPYYADKDVRTITQLVDYSQVLERSGEFNGVKHYGIDDCKHQVKLVYNGIKILQENKH